MLSSRPACFAAVILLASACARPRPTMPPAPPAPPPAPPPAASPPAAPTATIALDELRTAETFDDAHVGIAGELSRYVADFRVVLAEPNARASFDELVEHGTPAGRLYGAAGLYFTYPAAFDGALARIAARGGQVTTRRGCFHLSESVAIVIRSNGARRVEIAKGTTLASWFAANPKGGQCDLAGGCVPLMFVEDGRPAPR